MTITSKEAMKLKNEINEKIGGSVYSLFPEIKLDIFLDGEKIHL